MSTEETHLHRLRQSLLSCSAAVEREDFGRTEALTGELSEFLNSVSDAAISDPDDKASESDAISVLSEILSYLSDPNLDQAVIDALSFELPKAAAKFSGVSKRCLEIVDDIVDLFTRKCTPRDLVSIFCEAIDCFGKTIDAPRYLAPLLRGFSKVVPLINRRHFEQLRVAVPVILNALKVGSADFDDRVVDSEDLFERALGIASSIQKTCEKLDGRANELLRALLGLFILQILALVSISLAEATSCVSLVSQLEHFFPYCGLYYSDLITGLAVQKLEDLIIGDDEDECLVCFSYVKHGAVLSVIWAQICNEASRSAEQNLSGLKDELRSNQTDRWRAISMMRHVFSMDDLPWKLKSEAVDILLFITENTVECETNEDLTCSLYTPGLIAALQALMKVIMYSPDASLRRNALNGLKRVLADNPSSLWLDILDILVKNSSSSSMIAILLDCTRELLQKTYRKQTEQEVQQEKSGSSTPFWCCGILDLVEFVLRPPSGGPPCLPEQGDAVLSALNLYRYVLISESTGGTNYTGVVSKSSLRKAHDEWLLPLRTLVTGIVAESRKDYDEVGMDIICGLNPVEFVLYRCIELVEEKLKHSVMELMEIRTSRISDMAS